MCYMKETALSNLISNIALFPPIGNPFAFYFSGSLTALTHILTHKHLIITDVVTLISFSVRVCMGVTQESVVDNENGVPDHMGRVDEGVEEFFTKRVLPVDTV